MAESYTPTWSWSSKESSFYLSTQVELFDAERTQLQFANQILSRATSSPPLLPPFLFLDDSTKDKNW